MHNRYHYYMRYITFYDNLIFIHSATQLFQGFYQQHILPMEKEKQVPVKPHHWCPVCMTGSCIFKGRSRYFLTIVKTPFPGSKARYFYATKKPGKPRQNYQKEITIFSGSRIRERQAIWRNRKYRGNSALHIIP